MTKAFEKIRAGLEEAKGMVHSGASASIPTETEAARFAAVLNGCEYREEGSRELWAEMKAAGLVAVFGASDDLMEFRGAIDDELSAYGGTTALVTPEGLFEPCEARCKAGREARQAAVPIEAMWDNDGYSWTYKTDIPHATFDVIEDGEPYCRGIVFALSEATPAPSQAQDGYERSECTQVNPND